MAADELEPGPACQRFDAQEDLAELSRAAGLLLVPVMAFGRRGDGLAIGDARRPGLDFEPIDLAQALERV